MHSLIFDQVICYWYLYYPCQHSFFNNNKMYHSLFQCWILVLFRSQRSICPAHMSLSVDRIVFMLIQYGIYIGLMSAFVYMCSFIPSYTSWHNNFSPLSIMIFQHTIWWLRWPWRMRCPISCSMTASLYGPAGTSLTPRHPSRVWHFLNVTVLFVHCMYLCCWYLACLVAWMWYMYYP